MRDFLVGECGKSEYQAFYEVTYSEYLILREAFEMREHRAWDRIRMLAHNQYMLTPTKGVKNKSRINYYPLPMDDKIREIINKNRTYEVVTKKEKDKILKLFKN